MLSAAAAVLILGTIGFKEAEDLGTLDALYRAMQLFGFGGGVEPDPPVELQIARFLGPVIVGYAAVRGLLALFREQMQLLWFRLFLRDHMVIAGLGEVGGHLARRFNDLGWPVLVLEKDGANPLIPVCREQGISVLVGSASDRVALRRAQLRRATYLTTSCGHDQVDIEVAMAARAATLDRRGVLTTFANIGDPSLWRAVRTRTLSEASRRSMRLEPFHLLDSGASLVVEQVKPFDGGAAARVVVAAEGAMAQALVLHAARVWLNSLEEGQESKAAELLAKLPGRSALEIELVGAAAERDRDALLGRVPELETVCKLTANQTGVEDEALGERARDATAVFVGYSDESVGLGAALALRDCTRSTGVPVALIVREQEGGIAQSAEAAEVRVFGLFTQALGEEFLDRGMNEVMARAWHEEYVRAQAGKGEGPAENPSLVDWEQLPESLKQSNRRAVDGIGPKLNEIRAAVVPAPLVQLEQEPFEFLEPEVERLAVLEHERWVSDLTDEGWRLTEGHKDPERKRHPSLVTWEQLSPAEQQKDRDAVLAIPQVLRRAGYAIERLTPTPSSG